MLYRRISAIEVIRANEAPQLAGRSYTPPSFPVPVEGFWRAFADPTRIGHDERGDPITGKTWVRPHVRHKDKTGEAIRTVLVKASLSKAREQLERYRAGQVATSDDAGNKEPAGRQELGAASERGADIPAKEGATLAQRNDRQEATAGESRSPVSSERGGSFVYVMRCPAHEVNLFKVGFTDRDPEVRARELSSSTSSPTQFLVVQAWAVFDGLASEEAAHKALNGMRLSGSREFFRGPYSEIRALIESSISGWLLN